MADLKKRPAQDPVGALFQRSRPQSEAFSVRRRAGRKNPQVQLAKRHRLDFFVLDQSRPDIQMPVVPVIVPGLRPLCRRAMCRSIWTCADVSRNGGGRTIIFPDTHPPRARPAAWCATSAGKPENACRWPAIAG
jgi:hypothetical protein